MSAAHFDLMQLKFCVNLNEILDVIRFLVMTFFCVTLYISFLRKMLGTRYGCVGTRFSLILGT